jgi:hypothetical protein
MEVIVLKKNLEVVDIIDSFESLIWTDRYYVAGDFEITGTPSPKFINAINSGTYLLLKESEHLMEIERLNIHSDIENGDKVIVKGRSIEAQLDRRIIWNQTILTGTFQAAIHQLLDENAIFPSTSSPRKLSLLEFEASTDPLITALEIDSQFCGENLYKVICDLCISRRIGFKITMTDTGKFRFKLYAGADRSYDQDINPWVVFSTDYENLLNADYIQTDQLLKTVTLVAGEKGVGNGRRSVEVDLSGGAGSGLDRREMYTDASGVTRTVSGGAPLTDEEYDAQLIQKGNEDLAVNTSIRTFEGQADASRMTVYGEDFFMGDILQVANDYGHEAKSRVTELINSQDASGVKRYPTFSTIF